MKEELPSNSGKAEAQDRIMPGQNYKGGAVQPRLHFP
jgi:hypothetical protein